MSRKIKLNIAPGQAAVVADIKFWDWLKELAISEGNSALKDGDNEAYDHWAEVMDSIEWWVSQTGNKPEFNDWD